MRSHPEIALLSNGSYSVMITSAGTGASAWRDLDVTRWREDATRDCWGQFYYVRDLGDDRCWSIGTHSTSTFASTAPNFVGAMGTSRLTVPCASRRMRMPNFAS